MFIFIKFKLIQPFFSPLLQRQIILSNPFKSSRADYLAPVWSGISDSHLSQLSVSHLAQLSLSQDAGKEEDKKGKSLMFGVKVELLLLLSLINLPSITYQWIHNHFCLPTNRIQIISAFKEIRKRKILSLTGWLCQCLMW